MQTEKVVEHIVDWLKNYNQNAGMNGFVVGVSGGIDSAVTSTLCALTNCSVLVLELPIHQQKEQVSRARNHMDWLANKFTNVSQQSIDLTQTFDYFSCAVNADLKQENTQLALANSRARLRMATLYYYAGLQQRLVAGTGNKVEDFGVGFFTKYGDGGVDLSPIADLLKSQVYQLAEFLGVIDEIQNAQPTDGLWLDNRTDEQQMGASYDELEWAMGFDGDIDSLNQRQQEVLRIYNKLNRAMQHKINPIPVCEIPSGLLSN